MLGLVAKSALAWQMAGIFGYITTPVINNASQNFIVMNETDNPDEICDDCKFSIRRNDDVLPTFLVIHSPIH